jgi:hypothetical protein
MLETLTLVEVRGLPTLPNPRPATKEKVLALAALVDVPVDITPRRTGILPSGCWWMPQAQLVLYGSACQPPILLDEVAIVCQATGLSGLIVRDYSMPATRTRYIFDALYEGGWFLRKLLWISKGGTCWLVPEWGGDTYMRLSPCGLDMIDEPPFQDRKERFEGLARGADYLSSFNRRR